MNQKQPKIEIEPIMDQIRQQVKSNDKIVNPSVARPLGEGVQPMTLDELRQQLNEYWDVSQRQFTSHRPIIGPLIVWYKKILFKLIKLPLCNQFEFNALVTQTINALAEDRARKEQIQHLFERTDFLFTELDKKIETVAAKSQTVITKQQMNEETISTLKNNILTEQTRVTEIDDTVKQIATRLQEEREGLDSHTYHLFNEKFRDTVDAIKKRQQVYLDYFKGRTNVVDLGCGRGEFLDLLHEHNISALGIDINEEMIAAIRQRGLQAQTANLLDFLNQSPENSFDGIFSAQVIEHLTLPDIRRMLGLCYQKMQPNGVIIIETLNPLSYYSYSRNYLLDLTHQRPLHPQALKFLMQCDGFRNVEIKFTSSVALEEMMQGIEIPKELNPEQVVAWGKVNLALAQLNELFFGWQEYAVIAEK
ncbi:MAG: class I SAM-dependent methyltransferase [bacterium]